MGKFGKCYMVPNGDMMVEFWYYECSICHIDIPESDGYTALADDYLCHECIKELFFDWYDIYSIPQMEEVKGLLNYTSKALGKRQKIPQLMREKVFKRDNYTCRHCGSTDLRTLTIDHISPFVHGGKDKFENFQTLCRPCNSRKGAKKNYVPAG